MCPAFGREGVFYGRLEAAVKCQPAPERKELSLLTRIRCGLSQPGLVRQPEQDVVADVPARPGFVRQQSVDGAPGDVEACRARQTMRLESIALTAQQIIELGQKPVSDAFHFPGDGSPILVSLQRATLPSLELEETLDQRRGQPEHLRGQPVHGLQPRRPGYLRRPALAVDPMADRAARVPATFGLGLDPRLEVLAGPEAAGEAAGKIQTRDAHGAIGRAITKTIGERAVVGATIGASDRRRLCAAPDGNRLGAISHAEFLEHLFEYEPKRTRREVQACLDLVVREPAAGEVEHFGLPSGQIRPLVDASGFTFCHQAIALYQDLRPRLRKFDNDAVRNDAESWLADLYRSHFGAVYRVCRSLLWNAEEAADAAHDVFAIAVRGPIPRDNDAHTRSWLLSVARRRSIDLLRQRRRLSDALARVGEPAAPADPEGWTIDRSVVSGVLARLKPRERRLLWQSAVERQPIRDIADGLQLSYMSTAQALRRARRRAAAIASGVAAILTTLRPRRVLLSAPAAGRLLMLALLPVLVVVGEFTVQAQPTLPNRGSGGHQLANAGTTNHARSRTSPRTPGTSPSTASVPATSSLPASLNAIRGLPAALPLAPIHAAALVRALRGDAGTIIESRALPSIAAAPSSTPPLPLPTSVPH